MTFIARVDKQKAILLRKLGWGYEDIAKELDCTRDWCCKNLKGVERDIELMRKAYEFVKDSDDPQYIFPFCCKEDDMNFILKSRDNT